MTLLQKGKKDVKGLIVFGSIGLMYGFGVYYLVPLSLVSFNFEIVTGVFMSVLFGMMLSMATFFVNIMPLLNKIIGNIFLSFECKSMKRVVLKNLIAHRERNQMTTLMYSLTLGFIVFISVVCRVPFLKEVSDFQMHQGLETLWIRPQNIPLVEFENLIKKYEYGFDALGASTTFLYNKFGTDYYQDQVSKSFLKEIDLIKISDISRRRSDKVGVIGLSPFFTDVLEKVSLEVADSKPNTR